jgi:hypothetical protein
MSNELETKTSNLPEGILIPEIPIVEKIPTAIEEVTPKDLEKILLLAKEITLSDGSKLTIKKLKVGKYYQAQKHFSEWISELQKAVTSSSIDYSDYIGEDGKPDMLRIQKELESKGSSNQATNLLSAINKTSVYKIRLASIGLEKTEDDVEELYYADDIDLIVMTMLDVNDFMGNLKNFAAPIANLGAKMN